MFMGLAVLHSAHFADKPLANRCAHVKKDLIFLTAACNIFRKHTENHKEHQNGSEGSEKLPSKQGRNHIENQQKANTEKPQLIHSVTPIHHFL